MGGGGQLHRQAVGQVLSPVDDGLHLELPHLGVDHAADLGDSPLIGLAVVVDGHRLAGGEGLAHRVGDIEGDRLVAAVGDDKGGGARGGEVVLRHVYRLHHPGDGGGEVVEGELVLGRLHPHLGGPNARLGGVQRGPGGLHPGLGGQKGLMGLVHLRLGGGPDLQQGQSVVVVVLGQAQLLLEEGQVGPAVVGHGAVVALLGAAHRGLGVLKAQAGALVVKAAQQVPGGDGVPHRDGHLFHIAGYHGHHAGGALGGDGADVGALGAQIAGLDGGGLHRDRGVQHRFLHLLLTAAQGQDQGAAEQGGSCSIHRRVLHPFSRSGNSHPARGRP